MNAIDILSAVKQGILICDRNSRIIYFNQAYGEYIGVSLGEAKGKKLTDYRPGALAPQVIATGVPVEGLLRCEGAQEYFASVYPIVDGDVVWGSVSLVTSVEQSRGRERQKEKRTLSQRVREFEREEIGRLLSLYGSDLKGKKQVAEELGISLATLYNKISEADIKDI